MGYKILDTKYNHHMKNLEIRFSPLNDVLNSFFASVDIDSFGRVLQYVARSESYYQSPMSLRFYKNLDWEDLQDLSTMGKLTGDEVVVYHEVYGETIIKESLLIQIMLDYSRKLIEVYKNESVFSKTWVVEMNDGIRLLENKFREQK